MNKKIYLCIFLFCLNALGAKYENLSHFEKLSVNKALRKLKLSIDDNPINKTIKDIIIYIDSPFNERDCFSLLNYLHINTKEYIVKHDLFINKNDTYDEEKILHNEIALKKSSIRSVSVIVPVQNKNHVSDNEVILLVVTRDLFSLSLDTYFSGYNLNIDEFSISLSERNLLGTNQSLSIAYSFEDTLHNGSISYKNPKLFNSSWELQASPKLLLNNKFKINGFYNYFSIQKPILSVNDLWSYGFKNTIAKGQKIETKGAEIRVIDILNKKVEYRYDYINFDTQIHLNRYFGERLRLGLLSSYNFNLNKASIPRDLPLGTQEYSMFQKYHLPKNEKESFITLGLIYFKNEYMILYNYDTFLLQENKRLGSSISITNDFSAKFIFSDNNFIRPKVNFSYTKSLGTDAFVSGTINTSNKYDGVFKTNKYSLLLDIISPTILNVFRLVAEGKISFIFNNSENTYYGLGAKNGLRSVVPNYFIGSNLMRANVELRSMPIHLDFMYAGLVIFYDAGSAFSAWDLKEVKHALGMGIRILVPEFNTETIRLDLASPLDNPKQVLFSFGLGQAF